MITVKLREAIDDYNQRSGEKLTYEKLAARTGLAKSTIESIATRAGYNPSLHVIDRICVALGCTPSEILGFTPHDPPTHRGTSE